MISPKKLSLKLIVLKNHPFYNNSQTIIDTEGRVERFMKKYGLNSIKK